MKREKAPEKKYTVYMHTSPSGKVYVGVTCVKPETRWRNGHGYFNNEHFKKAILRYGWKNFKHEILYEGLSRDEAYQKEIELIQKYNSTDQEHGYNHHKGGNGSHVGYIPDEVSQRKRSEKMKGRFTGKYVGGKSPRARKIEQYTRAGELVKIWDAARDAERSLGIGYDAIIKCCNGKRMTAGGFLWAYDGEGNRITGVIKKLEEPKKLSQEQREKIRASMTGQKHETLSKAIIAVDIKTGKKTYYESISETSKDGYCPQNVSKCLNDKYPHSKTLKGHYFIFADLEGKVG